MPHIQWHIWRVHIRTTHLFCALSTHEWSLKCHTFHVSPLWLTNARRLPMTRNWATNPKLSHKSEIHTSNEWHSRTETVSTFWVPFGHRFVDSPLFFCLRFWHLCLFIETVMGDGMSVASLWRVSLCRTTRAAPNKECETNAQMRTWMSETWPTAVQLVRGGLNGGIGGRDSRRDQLQYYSWAVAVRGLGSRQ